MATSGKLQYVRDIYLVRDGGDGFEMDWNVDEGVIHFCLGVGACARMAGGVVPRR